MCDIVYSVWISNEVFEVYIRLQKPIYQASDEKTDTRLLDNKHN